VGLISRLYGYYARIGRKIYEHRRSQLPPIIRKTIEVSGDRFTYYLPNFLSDAAVDVSLAGIREPYTTHLFYGMMRDLPDDVVHVDIGAHYGYYAAIASRFRRVEAYEPLPGIIFDALRENLDLNGRYSYSINNVAVWPGGGGVSLHVPRSRNFSRVSDDGDLRVPAVDPADIVPDAPFTVRMDIEGGEVEVVPRLLSVSDPVALFIEHHPNIAGSDKTRQLFSLLLSHGYFPVFYFEPIVSVMLVPGWRLFDLLGYIGYQGSRESVDHILSRGWVVHALWIMHRFSL